jgi:hypothetical protein
MKISQEGFIKCPKGSQLQVVDSEVNTKNRDKWWLNYNERNYDDIDWEFKWQTRIDSYPRCGHHA